MSTKKLRTYRREVKELKLNGWLSHYLKKQDLTYRKLSRILGMSDGYLHRLAQKGDFTGAQLVALGNYLDTNPFEPYLPLLNEQARPTQLEKSQAEKIIELEEKIMALEKERDWLKEVVMKK